MNSIAPVLPVQSLPAAPYQPLFELSFSDQSSQAYAGPAVFRAAGAEVIAWPLQKTPLPTMAALSAVAPETGVPAQLDRLQHLLDILPTGIIVLDARGFVQEANPVARAMLGEPLIGQRWLDIITRSFRPRSDDGLEVSLHDGRRVQLTITALEPEPGQLIVLTDLTETRQLQSRVAHLQRLSALGKMMASLAHQIRTPLASAMLYAQNLTSQKLDPTARVQFSQKLFSRLQDLEQQVNDLLMFARSGREQQVAAISLQQLLSEVHQSVEALVEQHQGQILVELPQPDLPLLGNHTALCGAVSNLIQNALQHAGPGACIELSAIADEQAQRVTIAVEDHGPGVPEHLQLQIFEPFFTTRSNGTGLGLAVVQAVATSHNGYARCVAGRHGGARFEMILPVLQTQRQGTEIYGSEEEYHNATN